MDRIAWGYVFLPVAVLLWSGNTIIGKAAVTADVPPIALAFARWALALAILAPLNARAILRVRAVFRRHWVFFVSFGILSVGLYNALYYFGLQYTTAIQGALIQSLLPVAVVLSGALFLRQPITARQGAGVAVSITGAAMIVTHGRWETLGTLAFNVGDLWCLAAVAAWTVQMHITRLLPREVGLWPFLTVIIAVGVIFMVPFLVWEASTGRTMPLTSASAFYVGYTGIVASIAAFALWNAGVLRVGATTSGYFGNLFPVFSAALAITVLDEALAWYHLSGAVLILGGIYLATVSRRRAVPQPAA